MQRHDLRRRAQPDRLRARDLVADPRASGRQARGHRIAFREPGAEQPQRCLRAFERGDLFFRTLVWAHACLWRRTPAPARIPGRLSRPTRWGRAETVGRSLFVRATEWAL